MGTHRRPSPTAARARTAVLGTVAGAAVLLPVTSASAEPVGNLDQIKAKVDRLYEEAESATEQYNKVDERSKQLQGEAGKLQDRLAGQQGKIVELRETLGALAAEQYRSGGIDPTVQLMFSSSPDEYLKQANLQGLATGQQSDALRAALRLQQSIDQDRAETAAKLAELEEAHSTLAGRKAEIQGKLGEAARILSGLKAADRAKVNGDNGQAASRGSARESYSGPATGRAKAVLDFAYAQVGKPYHWGSQGPDMFDCSGLTRSAYRAGDVSLPRMSQDQWNSGKRIARSDLQPGDLLFYYGDLHHVGLYVGNGKVLHAPRSGKNVEVVGIDTMPYMGAVRP
ncbi:NlpC/P60 family protein [Kitasatospora sp. NPDC088391]|uniref:C40 family peptidase n=1 Tax=Kitasatospora sp. NPDC088391 TaxID=3364074 RepID=UPI0037F8E72F